MNQSDVEQELTSLRRALASRDLMVDIAGHDLRNPLHSLSIALAELDNPELPSAQRKQFTAAARRSLGKMDRILTDFIEINHLESGRLEIPVQPVAAAWLLGQAKAEHAEAAAAAGFEIDVAAAEVSRFLAAPDRALQVLGRLINNSIRFARGGSTISLTCAAVDDTIEIVVKDDGPGFSPSSLPDPFDRLSEAARARRAHGIGMRLAQGLVLAMGGTIAAGNGADGGAEIRIAFRAAP